MKLRREHLWVVLVNILVLCGLLAALALLPPAAVDLYKMVRSLGSSGASDPRALLPNYQDKDWARRHFEEFASLRTSYQDFIGWRRAPFAGMTITIDADGYRRHGNQRPFDASGIWVFGGSTVWGPGVGDDGTIPARLQALSSRSTFNFGEAAYTAHQSYNLLMKIYLLGGRPGHVVFYDGVNEVVHKCRAELSFYSTAQEAVIRERLTGVQGGPSLLVDVFAPTLAVFRMLGKKLAGPASATGSELFDCHSNEAKRKRIAAALVMDWTLAKSLVEKHGGKFLPVLQPVAHLGAPNLRYLDSVKNDALLHSQYEAVYAEIVSQLRQAGLEYVDLTRIHDGEQILYIDFCHVSSEGNERVAARIAAMLQP